MLKTIFFDLDGVIVDSEPIHDKAIKFTLDRFGIDYPPSFFNDFRGQPDDLIFKHVSENLDKENRPWREMVQQKQRHFAEIQHEIRLVDGFLPFIHNAKSKGIKTALVSSTSLHDLEVMDGNFNIIPLFDLLITETDTENHKPHPDPYLKALETLPASTDSTIVIEDSINGIVSAKKAGCKVVALTTSFPADKLSDADEVFDGYAALSERLEF